MRGKGTKRVSIQKKKIVTNSTQKPPIKGAKFVKILKEEVKTNPGIRGANYDIVRDNVCRKLDLSKKEFDEILGYMIKTDKIHGVWLFTGGGQAKVYHKNMEGHIFDSIDEMGEGIRYYKGQPQGTGYIRKDEKKDIIPRKIKGDVNKSPSLPDIKQYIEEHPFMNSDDLAFTIQKKFGKKITTKEIVKIRKKQQAKWY